MPEKTDPTQEQEEHFHALNDLLLTVPAFPENEAEADIAEAIVAVRAAKRMEIERMIHAYEVDVDFPDVSGIRQRGPS